MFISFIVFVFEFHIRKQSTVVFKFESNCTGNVSKTVVKFCAFCVHRNAE